MKFYLTLILIAMFVFPSSLFAAGSSASYKIVSEVIDSGGQKGTSASYSLLGKSRDLGLALPASASFVIGEGFLRTIALARPVLAPIVTAVDPTTADNSKIISLAFSGANFAAGATVKLSLSGETDISASNVKVVAAGTITGDFDLRGVKAGLWTITVTNLDGRAGSLPAALKVTAAAPTVASITPDRGLNSGTVEITNLSGANFLSGATAKLVRTGENAILGENVTVVSSTKITCRFDLSGKTVGVWDVVITNADGASGTLSAGFKIEAPELTVVKPIESDKNPFTPSTGATAIKFSLSKDADMTIYIFNIRGERIWEYRAKAGEEGGKVGENRVLWDGLTAFREYASAGVYLVHLTIMENGTVRTLSTTKIAIIK